MFPDLCATFGNTAFNISTNFMVNKKLPSGLQKDASISFSCSIKPLDNTFTSRNDIKIKKGCPVLWVLRDQSFPGIMEGPGGRVVGITRVEDATFDSLCSVLKASLPTCGGPVFPVILICAPVELLRLDVRAFLVQYYDFEKWLAIHLLTGKDPDSVAIVKGEVATQNTRFFPSSPPSIKRT